MAQAYIFDMDGVLIDSEPWHFHADQQLFAGHGVDFTYGDHEDMVGHTSMEAYAYWAKKFSLDVSPQILAKEKDALMRPLLKTRVPLMPGALELIHYFHEKKLPMALASSSERVRIDIILRKFDLERFFAVTVSGDEVKNSKPDPEIFLKAAGKLGIDPAACCVIEDAKAGVAAAKAAGMSCIGLISPGQYAQDLSLADCTVLNLSEVIAAHDLI